MQEILEKLDEILLRLVVLDKKVSASSSGGGGSNE